MRSVRRAACVASIVAALGVPFMLAGCAGTSNRASVGEQIDDSTITSKVKAAFVADRTVGALDIAVETFKGTVQLSGIANSQAEISRAVEIASDVRGVKSVRNDIRLKAAS
jgi:osmotically-inducible protein OsmY